MNVFCGNNAAEGVVLDTRIDANINATETARKKFATSDQNDDARKIK